MRTLAIVQARMGSKRFPGKVMAELGGELIVHRALWRAAEIVGAYCDVVLAIPDTAENDRIEKVWPRIVRGPEGDVLERFYLVSKEYEALDHIVRITADCPLLNVERGKELVKMFKEGGCGYAAIDWPNGGFPKGWGVEIFERRVLHMARDLAKNPYEREHVTPWMQENVCCKYLHNDSDESHLNYCVDTPDDLARLEKILCENET